MKSLLKVEEVDAIIFLRVFSPPGWSERDRKVWLLPLFLMGY